ncbi:DnaD and phage-associated domain-containing protein [Ruminococcus sp. YRD2003]|uniref:DnaD domain protein n=1 Tax=Ruminococcus sp. YRD2003 TaxID=1452313 RepID=UPI0008CEFB23|nr:DnaD and phage-associated domain-containing protein [Ruminococcus flavefaciens]
MEFKANCGVWGTMFGVPCVVADNFLKLATGEQIKVLLYLLRASGRTVSTEEIAANTGVTTQQAEEAVLFWQQVNVLSSDNSISVPQSIMTPPAPQQSTNTVSVEETLLVKSAPEPRRRENLRPTEITDIMKDTPAVAELFKAAESILGHINNTMQNSLIWMTNYLGLKAEVILVLLVYCEKIEKTNVAYIEKIAMSWAEKDINTLDSAQEEIERLTSSNDFVGIIMKMFEMKRRPTSKQLDIIEKWRAAGYARDMIHYAYEKTVENTGKLSFEYTDKVLASWKDSGFRSSEDVKRAESDFRKRKKAGSDSNDSFDAEKYNFVINNF